MLGVWFFVIGTLLILMAFASRAVQRLPVSAAIIYLALGAMLGPLGMSLLVVDPQRDIAWIEATTEVAVLISLFAVGLKIDVGFSRSAWRVPLRLATFGMVITIGVITLGGMVLLDLPWPLALLLGAVLAPTDPVLASDVQIHAQGDRNTVRFAITAEGAVNDGAAFPVVLLGLVLLGLRDGGPFGTWWLGRDLLWATGAGLFIGWACGRGVAAMIGWLRRRGEQLQFEEFLSLGVIALAYGAALLVDAFGFLAVFAAGLGAHQGERAEQQRERAGKAARTQAVAGRLLALSEQFERLAEVAVVLLIGALLAFVQWRLELFAFAAAVLLVARPLAVWAVTPSSLVTRSQRRLIAWFGIRGIGSLYYLAYAIHHGVQGNAAQLLLEATLVTVAVSIVVHGVSATPLMERYQRRHRAAE